MNSLLTDHIKPGKIYFRDNIIQPRFTLSQIDSVALYLERNLKSVSPFVYLFAVNHMKTACYYFGIIKAGKICILVNPSTGPVELAEMMNDTPAAAWIRIEEKSIELELFKEVMFKDEKDKDIAFEELDDVCTMVYTAADDGFSKAAMLTSKNMMSLARAGWRFEVSCSPMPFYHLFSVQTGLIIPFLYGDDTLIGSINNGVKKLAEEISAAKVSHLFMVPICFYMLSKVPMIRNYVQNVKFFISGSYKLKDWIYNKCLQSTAIPVREGYGLTECSPVCTWNHPEKKINIESVGSAAGCCEIRIRPQNGISGGEGQICIKGDNVMKGYYRRNKINSKVLKDGWFHTGDKGKMDKNGYLYFTGLLKRMINSGGEKIYPAEVERIILGTNMVKKIKIDSEPDMVRNSKSHAYIELIKDTDANRKKLINWIKRNLTPFKIPHSISWESDSKDISA